MQNRFIYLCWIAWLVASNSQTHGHNESQINAYVTPFGQLAFFDHYGSSKLSPLIDTDTVAYASEPGLGFHGPEDGFELGRPLFLNVLQGLLYWDGSNVTSTDETLTIDWPEDGGSSLVESYEITADSEYQAGMLWGIYQPEGGDGTWGPHGDYYLESTSPQVGIYGVVLHLASPGYISSEPFLFAHIYDPSSTLGARATTEGIPALLEAVVSLPTADFDHDTQVDQLDLAIWENGFGTLSEASHVQGDATGNGIIAGEDFLAWQRQYSKAIAISVAAFPYSVPEPNSMFLAVVMGIISSFIFYRSNFKKPVCLTKQKVSAGTTTAPIGATANSQGRQPLVSECPERAREGTATTAPTGLCS